MVVKRKWVLISLVVIVLASFLLNDSLWKMLHRRRSISTSQAELRAVSEQIEVVRAKIATLKDSPKTMEPLVRKDLGYLRPGEKEVHFAEEISKKQ